MKQQLITPFEQLLLTNYCLMSHTTFQNSQIEHLFSMICLKKSDIFVYELYIVGKGFVNLSDKIIYFLTSLLSKEKSVMKVKHISETRYGC